MIDIYLNTFPDPSGEAVNEYFKLNNGVGIVNLDYGVSNNEHYQQHLALYKTKAAEAIHTLKKRGRDKLRELFKIERTGFNSTFKRVHDTTNNMWVAEEVKSLTGYLDDDYIFIAIKHLSCVSPDEVVSYIEHSQSYYDKIMYVFDESEEEFVREALANIPAPVKNNMIFTDMYVLPQVTNSILSPALFHDNELALDYIKMMMFRLLRPLGKLDVLRKDFSSMNHKKLYSLINGSNESNWFARMTSELGDNETIEEIINSGTPELNQQYFFSVITSYLKSNRDSSSANDYIKLLLRTTSANYDNNLKEVSYIGFKLLTERLYDYFDTIILPHFQKVRISDDISYINSIFNIEIRDKNIYYTKNILSSSFDAYEWLTTSMAHCLIDEEHDNKPPNVIEATPEITDVAKQIIQNYTKQLLYKSHCCEHSVHDKVGFFLTQNILSWQYSNSMMPIHDEINYYKLLLKYDQIDTLTGLIEEKLKNEDSDKGLYANLSIWAWIFEKPEISMQFLSKNNNLDFSKLTNKYSIMFRIAVASLMNNDFERTRDLICAIFSDEPNFFKTDNMNAFANLYFGFILKSFGSDNYMEWVDHAKKSTGSIQYLIYIIDKAPENTTDAVLPPISPS